MKKIIISLFLSLFTLSICFSQDTITLKTSEDIKAKVLEVSPTEIKYKRFDNLEGPVHIVFVADVLMIRYENGTKGIFNVEKAELSTTTAETTVSTPVSTENLFYKGQNDAVRYYNGYKGAGTGTLVVSLLSPIAGLIPAILCSASAPKERNLNYPDAQLMSKDEYYTGYKFKAKKIKQGKVWTNWGIALGVNVFLILALSSGQ